MSSPAKRTEIRRSELLADVAARATQIASDYGFAAQVAEQVGAEIADHIAEAWGGQVVSIPKDFYYRLAHREQAILEEWRAGATFAELAEKYCMHVRSLRRLIGRARIRNRNFDQPDLFGE